MPAWNAAARPLLLVSRTMWSTPFARATSTVRSVEPSSITSHSTASKPGELSREARAAPRGSVSSSFRHGIWITSFICRPWYVPIPDPGTAELRRHGSPGVTLRSRMGAESQIVAGISLPLIHGSELLKAITIPLFTGRDRLRDQLERGLDALLPGALRGLPASRAWRRSPACCRARSSRSRGSCTAASAGRGSSPRAPRRWARSRSTRGSPSSAARPSSTSSSSPSRSPSTSSRPRSDDIRDVVERIMRARAPAALERPAAARARGGPRSASSSSCPTSCATVTDEIGDQHRPAARREADGDPAHRGSTRSSPTASSSTSAAAELRLIDQLRLPLRLRCSASRSSS